MSEADSNRTAGEEAETYYAELAEQARSGPQLPLDAAALRELYPVIVAESMGGDLYTSERAREVVLDAEGGSLKCRVIESDRPSALYLHVHGGGWAFGSPELDDARTEHLAREAGVTTVSVRYRLSPEDRFPAGLDDCERAARYLLTNGAADFGSERLFIGGESAGANLALETALRLIRRPSAGGVLCGLNLLYGNYDLGMTPSQRRSSAVLSPEFLDWVYSQYCSDEKRRDPEVSPLYAELSGLPPILLTAGSKDAMVDDSLFLAARLEIAAVPFRLSLLPGADHGFDIAPLEVARLAKERIVDFFNSGGEVGGSSGTR